MKRTNTHYHSIILEYHGIILGGALDILLMTDDTSAHTVLSSLTLLAHSIKLAALEVNALLESGSVHVTIVDARNDLVTARSLTKLLNSTGSIRPVIVVVNEGGLVALNADWGIDDFLLPTVSPAELETRLRLLLDRHGVQVKETPSDTITLGELVVMESSFTARLKGKPLDLTYKEFELLKYLSSNVGRVFTRSQLLQEVWGYDFFGGSRTVDVHIRRLRAKLGREYSGMIATVRNVGYKAVRPKRNKSGVIEIIDDDADDDFS